MDYRPDRIKKIFNVSLYHDCSEESDLAVYFFSQLVCSKTA